MKLDREQWKIITSRDSHTLVVAGHGTGKTLLVAHKAIREARRLKKNGAQVSNRAKSILILTHTTNARDKIINRICAIEKNRNLRRMIEVLTFHSYALKLLYRNTAVRPKISHNYAQLVVDKIDSDALMGGALSSSEKEGIITICEFILDRGVSLQRIHNKWFKHFKSRKKVLKVIMKADKLLRQSGAIPIQQLPSLFCDILKNETIKPIKISFPKMLIVDEFQDIIDSQWEMIKSINYPKTSIFVIGDPDQAIFAWAGASSKRFEQFQNRYKPCVKYQLNTNYRSSKQIVKFCDAIRKNASKIHRLTSYAKFTDSKPKIICSKDYRKLISFLIKYLKRLESDGVSLNEVAILYRFHTNRRILVSSLESNGIPYQVYERAQRKLRPIIRIIFAYDRIIRNINDKDPDSDIWKSWKAVLLLVDGVGENV